MVWNAVVATGPSSSTRWVQPSTPPSSSFTFWVQPDLIRNPTRRWKLGVMAGHTANGTLSVTASTAFTSKLIVHGQPDPHVMDRIARLDSTAIVVGERIGLDVRDVAFDIPQPVGAAETLAGNLTGMDVLAAGRG